MKSKTLFRALFFIVLFFPFMDISSQKIVNVHPAIKEDRILIHYDLLGIATDEKVLVTVYMSTDGGETYGASLQSVSGDVGMVTGPGKEKTITWDVFNDLDELVSVNVKFKVRAVPLDTGRRGVSYDRSIKFNLNANLGYRNQIEYNSYGLDAKGVIYLNQLGLGLRADYYRAFREEINYEVAAVVYPDTGYYWCYSAGAVIEYDLLNGKSYSLYPYLYIGQSRFNYTYNSDYRNESYFEYSIFGSFGIGFDAQIYSFLYVGLEAEYVLSPWIDLVPSASPDEAMDGLRLGIVLKFVIDTN